jgi:hypothetical protein
MGSNVMSSWKRVARTGQALLAVCVSTGCGLVVVETDPAGAAGGSDAGVGGDAGVGTAGAGGYPAPPNADAGACPDDCAGCCDAQGACLPGTDPTACGLGGAACADCSATGSLCDPAVGVCPAAACECAPGLVYRRHECVPTREIGCGETCTPGETDCGQLHTCEPCAATSTCATKDCRATCLFTGPVQGPIAPGVLRIVPTGGVAGEETIITIEGFPFYVGALMYGARMGDIMLYEAGSYGPCSFTVVAPGLPAGVMPVHVSQYGPTEPWVLAGFFAYGSGEGLACAQPGEPCAASADCCSLPEAPTSCAAGRCTAD